MDNEGFVPLNVIGRFNRVRALTQDLNLIREVGGSRAGFGYDVMVM